MGGRTSVLSNNNVDERYSFSRLSLYHTCPYAFKLSYLDEEKGISNAFASYGSLMHSILERYAKGELELWDLKEVFEWEFDSMVTENFPFDKSGKMRENYFRSGIEFLKSFQGYDDIKILGVEREFLVDISDWHLYGFIDLIYENQNGELVIRDYKSKSSFKNKNEQKEYARQLYLYATYIKEAFGKFPDKLEFLMFRSNKTILIDFNEEDYEEAIEWASNTVKEIRDGFDYPPKCEKYYSSNICDFREICELREY